MIIAVCGINKERIGIVEITRINGEGNLNVGACCALVEILVEEGYR